MKLYTLSSFIFLFGTVKCGKLMKREVVNASCYQELGCFPQGRPWKSLLRPFPPPRAPIEINTKLYCFTRENRNKTDIQLWPLIDLSTCSFSPEKRTVFITHGFSSSGLDAWLHKTKNNYLDLVDANVFIVDWEKGAKSHSYLQVASNTRVVGAEIGRFVKYLIEQLHLAPKNIHLIGHSLGAHIFSYVAKQTKEFTDMIDRITALDPAQPGFEGQTSVVRLDKSDATFIDVIHTNAEAFIPTLGLGMRNPVGHVDIYMNGGMRQEGCSRPAGHPKIQTIGDLFRIPVEEMSYWASCSHSRSHDYFAETLNQSCKIWAREAIIPKEILSAGPLGFSRPVFQKIAPCTNTSCIPLGLDTPKYLGRGVFAAYTKHQSPYCDYNFMSDLFRKQMANGSATSVPRKDAGTNTESGKHKHWWSKWWPIK